MHVDVAAHNIPIKKHMAFSFHSTQTHHAADLLPVTEYYYTTTTLSLSLSLSALTCAEAHANITMCINPRRTPAPSHNALLLNGLDPAQI